MEQMLIMDRKVKIIRSKIILIGVLLKVDDRTVELELLHTKTYKMTLLDYIVDMLHKKRLSV